MLPRGVMVDFGGKKAAARYLRLNCKSSKFISDQLFICIALLQHYIKAMDLGESHEVTTVLALSSVIGSDSSELVRSFCSPLAREGRRS